MPSRAEVRGGLETVLRVVSLAVLAMMLWLSLDRGRPENVVSARSANLHNALRDWSTSGLAPDRIDTRLETTPSALDRDWLRALRGAGSRVSWSGNLPAVGLSAQASPTPRGGWNVLASAPATSRVSIADEIGPIDTVNAERGGARYFVPSASGALTARAEGTTASAALNDSVSIKRLLVIGAAAWETKFVVAALEEDGWKVDSDMRITPDVNVTQGSLSPIDTARYSAVIVLDGSAASRATEISRYAASGGGVILSGSAAGVDAFANLRAGTTGRAVTPSVLESEPGSVSLDALSFVPLTSLRSDAIVLTRTSSNVTSAARRYGAGRVLQDGHEETWRWRMSGGDSGPDAHRAWWTRAVASVAYAPHKRTATAENPDNAPVAKLVDALGPASSSAAQGLSAGPESISLWLLFAILSLSLLAEWASRRLRGSR